MALLIAVLKETQLITKDLMQVQMEKDERVVAQRIDEIATGVSARLNNLQPGER